MRIKDEEKYSNIYNATLDLAAEVGLSGLTMAQIAKKAGIGGGTLYTYYSSKEKLLSEIYTQTLSVFEQQLSGHTTGDLPVKVALKEMYFKFISYFQTHTEVWNFQDQYLTSQYAAIDKRVIVYNDKVFQGLIRLLEQGKEELLIKKIDTTYFVILLLGFARQLSVATKIGINQFDDALVENSFTLYWDALRA